MTNYDAPHQTDRQNILFKTVKQIVNMVENAGYNGVSQKQLEATLRKNSKLLNGASSRLSKREVLSYYLEQKREQGDICRNQEVDDAVVCLLRGKPRRSASGVATVSVLTKPWPCGGDCICCPCDVRMPKSYLSDEPACQRAEKCYFDPYLQMTSRLRVLQNMGHNIDKVEVIVLGGTFSDYPKEYRIWFIQQLFKALNDFSENEYSTPKCSNAKALGASESEFERRKRLYEELNFSNDPEELAKQVEQTQTQINAGKISYNDAISAINSEPKAQKLSLIQTTSLNELHDAQRANEDAKCRCVGLCIETRPELATPKHLAHLRDLGCTKLQIGVQSLDESVLENMGRTSHVSDIKQAFSNMRLFGFKSHVHMMVNLPSSTPKNDKAEYFKLVNDVSFMPDEVKLYPCALVECSHLMTSYKNKNWRPYTEEELMDVLTQCLKNTPPHTRISRMIRDISSTDIVAGNKKTNLRQLVEQNAMSENELSEMRIREISTNDDKLHAFFMKEIPYSTSNTDEVFIQYVDNDDRLAAFCRLSMPHADSLRTLNSEMNASGDASIAREDILTPSITTQSSTLPIRENEAMIREVHVYGRVSKLHESKEGTQHLGFGRTLVNRACEIARLNNYASIAVISAVGTRQYYRKLGFECDGLYMRKKLL